MFGWCSNKTTNYFNMSELNLIVCTKRFGKDSEKIRIASDGIYSH